MFIRTLSIVFLALALSGCATSQLKTQNEQLSSRITDLEKNQQAKDAEIVDLQYQVKDLSGKVGGSKASEGDQANSTETENPSSIKVPVMINNSQIIRVKVSAEKIQTALKAAGVYTGPIDGKIGAGTKQAIVEFQKSHHLKADGVLGRRTWDELKTFLK